MKILTAIALMLMLASASFAQSHTTLKPQEIHLKNGTILKGRVIGISGDQYVIQTEDLGEVRVKMSNLQKSPSSSMSQPSAGISNSTSDPAPTPAQNAPAPAGLQQIQQQLLTDPEISAALQELSKDPEIQAMASDPELIKSAMSMDPNKIQNNPAAQKLLQNPKMQRVMQRATEKILQQSGPSSPAK